MPTKHLWQQAAAFAARAHKGHVRKDNVTPYFSHPVGVAMTIACVYGFDDEEILAAALLHDTIEDTDTDYDDIHEAFGKNVADYVAVMTKDMRLVESKREIAYDQQLARGPWQGRLIKLADVYDNLLDATKAQSRKKILGKASRILKLTAKDRQLARSRSILANLAKSLQSRNLRRR